MAQTKVVKNIREDNKLRAIESQAGFVSYVCGRVRKIGLETVLQQYKTIGQESEYYWLKQAYKRVLDFAEEVQVKEITQRFQGEGFASHTHLTLVIPKGIDANDREKVLS